MSFDEYHNSDDYSEDLDEYDDEEGYDDDVMDARMLGFLGGMGGYDGDFDGYDNDNEEGLANLDPKDLPTGWKIPSSILNQMNELEEDDLSQPVTFIRPDGDTEGKDVQWCLDNGFSEIEEGLWSGPWYWRDLGEEPPPDRTRVSKRKKGDWMESGLLTALDEETFYSIKQIKASASEEFSKKRYEKAVQLYDLALNKYPLTFVMPTAQLDEKVKILSNKAECLLRLSRNLEAGDAATEALILDESHEKSRFRRARANYRCMRTRGGMGPNGINPMRSCQVEEDLAEIIHANGPGKADAQALLDTLKKELRQEIERIRKR